MKQGLKLLGLFLLVGMTAASGCRGKKKPTTPTGPEDLRPIEFPQPGSEGGDGPGAGSEVTPPESRDATEFGFKVNVSLDPVMFTFDSATLNDAEAAKADRVAALLNDNPSYKVVIEGNADERGTAEYNMALGERRAQAVRAYLLNAGVPEGRIHTLSYGEEKPADPGHTESAWSRNRRADFAIYE